MKQNLFKIMQQQWALVSSWWTLNEHLFGQLIFHVKHRGNERINWIYDQTHGYIVKKMPWNIICSLLYVNIIFRQKSAIWQESAFLPWRISFPTSLNAGEPFCRKTTPKRQRPETTSPLAVPLSFPGRHPVAHAKQPLRPKCQLSSLVSTLVRW